MQSYEETIEYLFSLQNFGIKLGLTNIGALLKKLGSPHEKYKTVHIAGTNGKGSTAAMLESILISAGYRAGLYTSPHLVDFKERFRIDRAEIDSSSVVELTRLVREKKDELGLDIEITFFEYATALAFTYFAKEEVDVAIIETGMGGRLDATNVITPMVSVITGISKEHEQYLGDTIEEIAREKAGIIKGGVPLVFNVKDDRADAVIRGIAKERGVKCLKLGSDFSCLNASGDTFDYSGIKNSYSGLKKTLLGDHQFENAALAIAVTELIAEHGFDVDETGIREGLRDVSWPGRFEIVSDAPVIILDGAHNDESMETAVKTLRDVYPEKRVISVVGVMKDKDVKGILKRIADVSDRVILTKPEIFRAALPEELKKFFNDGGNVECVKRVSDALEHARGLADDDAVIFVTGSLFTVGDAKKHLLESGRG